MLAMKNIFRSFLLLSAITMCTYAMAQSDGANSNIAANPSFDEISVIDYPMPRPDDVMWSKVLWRMVDLREKVNHPLYFPTVPSDGRMSLFTYMFNLLQEGKIYAYRYDEAKEDFSKENRLSFGEICSPNILDIYYRQKTNESGDSVGVFVDPSDIPTSQIFKFYLKEVWYFDKHESTMKVKVLGLCPQRFWNSPDLGDQKSALFWISYDEIRPYLAQQPVVLNSYNNSQRVSFDDLFTKRRFASYIYKESNIYNRTLIDYCSSVEEVHAEQERIKKEILNYEQDLWEY